MPFDCANASLLKIVIAKSRSISRAINFRPTIVKNFLKQSIKTSQPSISRYNVMSKVGGVCAETARQSISNLASRAPDSILSRITRRGSQVEYQERTWLSWRIVVIIHKVSALEFNYKFLMPPGRFGTVDYYQNSDLPTSIN